VKVDIWSDVVCPWCYIGKHRFEAALAGFAGRDAVEVTYRSFQLDPTAPPGVATPVAEAYARKFGGPEEAARIIDRVTRVAATAGLDLRLDRAQRANTFLAHRLLWWAGQHGRQVAMNERLLQAYFVEGWNVGDPDTLAELAGDVGLDPAVVGRFLASDGGTTEVHAELRQAAEAGITAVPTFVFDERWVVPGAQDVDVFARVLERVAELEREATGAPGSG
jgi:predicted DsbA family dithiol-disulfide isomerase